MKAEEILVIFLALGSFAAVNGNRRVPGVSNNGLSFKHCGGIRQVEFKLHGCSATPCNIFAGRNHTIEGIFRSNKYTTSLNFEFLVKTATMREYSNVKFGNFCNHLIGKDCPLQRGVKYHIKYSMYIPSYVPDEDMMGALMVRDDKKGIIICGQMPIHVVGSTAVKKLRT